MGKAVEVAFQGDLFQARAVVVDQVQVKRWPAFCLCGRTPTRREDDPVAVRMEKRRKVGGAVPGHLLFARPIGVHHKEFQVPRLYQIPAQ